ncbi:MAG: UDP-3-O-(3-hydroxymyristoyl)glucosamine N-acyltransferase [Verrucomicrobiaceae bacterium]|nr:MAG: UDP-3-O-(3-hydroxymyristoyl)glucosamine N-acyltransferase [Verrucomicrobiaceae bacterium]
MKTLPRAPSIPSRPRLRRLPLPRRASDFPAVAPPDAAGSSGVAFFIQVTGDFADSGDVELTLAQLAALVRGSFPEREDCPLLTGFAALRDAGPGDFSFFGNERYLPDLRRTKASAVLVPRSFEETVEGVALVRVDNPSAAFAAVVQRFSPSRQVFKPGIHPSAVIDPSVVADPGKVAVGPLAVIEAGVVLGEGTTIGAGCFVGEEVRMGRNCLLHPRVTVYHHCQLGDNVALHSGAVVGADGFGYEFVEGRHRKIDQVGTVQIDNDVEVGANTTIDRARFGRTWIQEGVKIDNQVQIGHNCVIGRHAILVAQAGIAGSTRVGDYAVIAAQAGVAGHLEIGPGVVVLAQAGVTKSLLEKGQYMGFPAAPVAEMRRQMVQIRKTGDILRRLKALESQAPTSGKEQGSPTEADS